MGWIDTAKKGFPMPEVVNLTEKFKLFSEQWHPKIAGELNDSYVKIAKVQGEFVWHHHENEDELFFVVKGTLTIKLRDQELIVREGEFVVIPKGMEHMPVAEEEVWIMMLEPKTTSNTGNVTDEHTVEAEWI
jgi:mannose-6-phosphate isomerase-like protein (cupin superfamily)